MVKKYSFNKSTFIARPFHYNDEVDKQNTALIAIQTVMQVISWHYCHLLITEGFKDFKNKLKLFLLEHPFYTLSELFAGDF